MPGENGLQILAREESTERFEWPSPASEAHAARHYVEAGGDDERERARVALLLALEELDRHVSAATLD